MVARVAASVHPVVNHLVLAIVFGIVVGNLFGVPGWARSGVATRKPLLEAGIVIMGASIPLDRIFDGGLGLFLLVVTTIGGTILLVELLAFEVFDIQKKVSSLLAAGAGICGVSAVIAVAESIDASERDVAYASATILFFDAVMLVAYPFVGRALGLSDALFGIWAGLTMFSTGPVVAAGFAFSDVAGEWAVLMKLSRNALVGIAVVGYALLYARAGAPGASPGAGTPRWQDLWSTFPRFVVGFFVVMLLVNLGGIGDGGVAVLETVSGWLFVVAFAGLGMEIRVSEIRSTGLKPILVVLTSLIVVSSLLLLGLTTVRALG